MARHVPRERAGCWHGKSPMCWLCHGRFLVAILKLAASTWYRNWRSRVE